MTAIAAEGDGLETGYLESTAATHAPPGKTAMLIASDPGRSVYDLLGYLPLLRYTLYIGMRPPA
jgi:hypothetical protein